MEELSRRGRFDSTAVTAAAALAGDARVPGQVTIEDWVRVGRNQRLCDPSAFPSASWFTAASCSTWPASKPAAPARHRRAPSP